MATGVTSSITSDVSFTSHYQLTKDDDTLIIQGATVTMLKPQGDIFTDAGNDTVLIEDSLIVTDQPNLAFMLGSGDDTLTVTNTTFSAPVQTGSGNDVVMIAGNVQTKVRVNQELTFGTGDDLLELISMLENAGSIDFGSSGVKTLRFNGGTLTSIKRTDYTSGSIGSFTHLEVALSGGTTGGDLVLSGEQTGITLNGDFSGENRKVYVTGGTTTLSVGNNVRTAVSLVLNQANLIQTKNGGTLVLSDSRIKADDSTVTLHDIVVNGIATVGMECALTGSNTSWTLENGGFSEGDIGIGLTGGVLTFLNVAIGNYRLNALTLSGTRMTGSQLSLTGNGHAAMVLADADVDIQDIRATNNSAAAIVQNGGVMILTSATFSGNRGTRNPNSKYKNYYYASGGAILQNGGSMTLTSATFSGNYVSGDCVHGGALCLSGGATMKNVSFVGNSASGVDFVYGGAIYLAGTLNYVVTSGTTLSNYGNCTIGLNEPGYGVHACTSGGWLYAVDGAVLNITVEKGGSLIIGNDAGTDDSIEGTSGGRITKNGSGSMKVKSYIDSNLQWDLEEGSLNLEKFRIKTENSYSWSARNILLDKWSIGTNATLVLSELNDTIDMGISKRIGGVIDLGGGKDAINTGGYVLSDGTILFSDLTISGGGQVGSQLRNRSTTEGSALTLESIGLDSKFYGNAYDDVITVYGNSSLGDVDMGGGINSVHVMSDGNLSADKFKIAQGGQTTVYVYLGSTLANNTLTVYSDETAARDTLLLDWSEQTDLDKVRILVSSDPSSFQNDQYEFAVELYNHSKSFTLNLQKGYFIQFQAQDEDGWKQRLLTDHEAPDRVTGLRLDGSVLRWEETQDNPGGNGVKQYRVEISQDASFSTVWQDQTVIGTEYVLTSIPETMLYFRVCAEDYSGNFGDWSETVSGMNDLVPPTTPANENESINGYSATLSWSASTDGGSGVQRYEWRIASDSTFGQVVKNGNTGDCSVSVDNLKYGTYYWSVRAVDASGNVGDWSGSRRFSTVDGIAPDTPVNMSFSIQNEKTLSARWNAVSDDASGSGLKGYDFQLATDSAFGNIVQSTTVTSPEVVIEDLANATYYMRVRSVDSAGNKSVWTETKSFLIDPKPSAGLVLANESRTVVAGQQYTSTTITNGGRLTVLSDGMASATTISRGGIMYVSGGSADKTEVKSGGSLVMTWGELTGRTVIEQGAIVSMTSDASYLFDLRTVAPGNTALVTNLSLIQGAPSYEIGLLLGQMDGLYVLAEGAAGFDKTITVSVYSGGEYMWNGTVGVGKTDGPANYKLSLINDKLVLRIGEEESPVVSGLVLAAETRIVSSGGTYVNTMVNADGSLIVSEGGKANSTTVNSGGLVQIRNSGSASGTVVDADGNLRISSGGITTDTTVNGGGYLYVFDNGTANGVSVASNGEVHVSKGGLANGVTVSSRGRIKIGGRVNDLTMNGGAGWSFEEGGTVDGVIFHATGTVPIKSGTSVLNIRETGSCYVDVQNGAVASFASNSVSGITVSSGKSASIHSGTTANDVTLNGNMVIFSSGSMIGASVNASGSLEVLFGGIASETTVNSLGKVNVQRGGTAEIVTVNNGGILHVESGAHVGQINVSSGGVLTGVLRNASELRFYGGTLALDISTVAPDNDFLIDKQTYSLIPPGADTYSCTLTVDDSQAKGTYQLIECAYDFDKTVTVVNTAGIELGTLTVGKTISIGDSGYTLNLDSNKVLSVTVGAVVAAGPAKSDIDGNGISDVMFVWTGEHGEGNYQHGYWMNGTSEWRSQNGGHPAEWENLGCHDMTGDGKADSVMFGNVNEDGIRGAYIGYYKDGNDLDENWVTIGHLDNIEVDWKNKVGNLTGNEKGANSIVWYAPEMHALGAWKDGKEDWVSISESFGGDDWTLIGCGDFDGDGRDSIMMAYNGGQLFYTADIDGTTAEMGDANWSGWEVRAIGDFMGDGKDDMVLFHPVYGSMVMLADGRADVDSEGKAIFINVGQLSASDWFVVGAGDYNGDQKDDLLVRQYSTGMLGYYTNGDTQQWVELGRGVDMSWTVIA